MSLINFFAQHFNYNIFGISTLAGSILSLCVGMLVLFGNTRSKPHLSFFLIALTGGLWMFHYAMINLLSSEVQAYFWLRLGYLLAVPYISPSVYFFTLQWTGVKHPKKLLLLGFVGALVYGLIMFFNTEKICEMVTTETFRLNQYKSNLFANVYFYSLLAFFLFYASMAFKNVYKAWRNADSPTNRAQYRNFMIGFLIGYTALIDFIAARYLSILPFGFILFSIFILIMAYTIVRHQFLEINVVLKKISFIFLIYSILFALLLPVASLFVNGILKQSTEQVWEMVLILSVGIGVVLSLGPTIYASLVRHSFWLRGNISTGLTHELKTPLFSIQVAIDIAIEQLKKPESDKQKALEYLQMIKKNADRLEGFINNLLNVAKGEEAFIQINKSRFDFSELVQKLIDTHKPLLDQKGLRIACELPGPSMLEGDETKLEQVISNLLSNAIKFSNSGTLTIRLSSINSHLNFSIQDEGKGLKQKNIDKIFERFYQVSESSKGSGIGLTIAKAWVEAHGGKIWAESEGEGKGTTVRFTLPI